MMRALRSNQAYRGNMMTAPSTGSIFEGSGVDNMYQSARKGGRIVKGKKQQLELEPQNVVSEEHLKEEKDNGKSKIQHTNNTTQS